MGTDSRRLAFDTLRRSNPGIIIGGKSYATAAQRHLRIPGEKEFEIAR